MFKKGNIIKEKKYGYAGMVDQVFKNWEDLKKSKMFVTIDPHNESEEMDGFKKIIHGDPKDVWLQAQKIPFTDSQLSERWYSIRCFDGGSIWTCESMIELVDVALN